VSASIIPLWGRAWRLTVYTSAPLPSATEAPQLQQIVLSQDKWDPEALRITFDVLQSVFPSPYWSATITVYNLDDPTMQNVVQNAFWVTLEGGYQSGTNKRGVIWNGPVLQVMFGRPNVVDKTITFNCVSTIALLNENFVNEFYDPLFSQAQAVEKMILQTGGVPAQQISSYAAEVLGRKQYLRGKTVFGNAAKYFHDIASDNFLSYYIATGDKDSTPSGAHSISEIMAPNPDLTPKYIYSSAPPPGWLAKQNTTVSESIIGVPTQSPFGVDFTVLLDPRVFVQAPPMVLGLDFTVIDQLKAQLNQKFTPLPKGVVLAAQIRHEGDSRGTPWYTHITGVSPTWAQQLLDGVYAASAAGK
jgi:hypothetical protein